MENIKRYEAMAKLDLPENERLELSRLASMLTESFGAFSDVDTTDTAPLCTVLPLQTVLREDVSAKMISRDELLSNAPMQYDGYFQVPKTF